MCILGVLNHTKGIQMLSPSIKKILCVKGRHLQRTRKLLQATSSSGGECNRGSEPLMLSNMTFGPEIGTTSAVVPEIERSPDSAEQIP